MTSRAKRSNERHPGIFLQHRHPGQRVPTSVIPEFFFNIVTPGQDPGPIPTIAYCYRAYERKYTLHTILISKAGLMGPGYFSSKNSGMTNDAFLSQPDNKSLNILSASCYFNMRC